MPVRAMTHPECTVEDSDEGVLLRFRVSGSKFGSVEVTLSLSEAEMLSESLAQAVAFAEAEAT